MSAHLRDEKEGLRFVILFLGLWSYMGKDLLAVLLKWGISDTLFGLASVEQF